MRNKKIYCQYPGCKNIIDLEEIFSKKEDDSSGDEKEELQEHKTRQAEIQQKAPATS